MNGNYSQNTPLFDLHNELGARLVAFAGYQMPIQYRAGILAEHRHTRAAASLFDVSHMGQVRLTGENVAEALERLVPGDIAGLQPGDMRYTMFTNENGGIIDDLIVTRTHDGLLLVINASRKTEDMAHLRKHLGGVTIEPLDHLALIALQGPAAATVLTRLGSDAAELDFMSMATQTIGGIECAVSRSGYTGEDGFEISVAGDKAEDLARLLLAEAEVEPAGLGARDSLRLEAGLCLYGNDIDETTTPIEAGLTWSIAKRRRADRGFIGADRILDQLAEKPARKRVGIRPEGAAPARQHTPIVDQDGQTIGAITSGGFGPTVDGPVAMGYVDSRFAAKGTQVGLLIRGKVRGATVAALPFAPHRYVRQHIQFDSTARSTEQARGTNK
ncbi:MAG: glycine cleavage system aminomethyltransferase GcvT [Sphingomonadales bacterium]